LGKLLPFLGLLLFFSFASFIANFSSQGGYLHAYLARTEMGTLRWMPFFEKKINNKIVRH